MSSLHEGSLKVLQLHGNVSNKYLDKNLLFYLVMIGAQCTPGTECRIMKVIFLRDCKGKIKGGIGFEKLTETWEQYIALPLVGVLVT